MIEKLNKVGAEEVSAVEDFKTWLTKAPEFNNLEQSAQQKLIDYVRNCQREIADLKCTNIQMHNQVSGYLHGKEWDHWQKFNEAKYKVTT